MIGLLRLLRSPSSPSSLSSPSGPSSLSSPSSLLPMPLALSRRRRQSERRWLQRYRRQCVRQ
ncbi:hypothetical protein EEL33_03630 [Muribaculaceae bacterium Isolate-037 (Harlan)]|nr:hypothetical protein EEL33_03630 [Muribaculaceae bacterium Isolate-037 (Harlan)]